MPKKRIPTFNTATSQPSSSTPPVKPSRSVNERLAQLRAEQAPRSTVEHRNEIANLATVHSMPPALRQILQLPETAPLPPNIRSRRQRIINGRRAPPGPVAPESWLASSQHAPAHSRSLRKDNANEELRHVPTSFNKLAKLDDFHPLPTLGSLVDMALKSMARHWDRLVEYEQFNLSALPPFMKASLLSYLGVYGPKEGITSHDLKVLFLGEHELPGATGSEEVSRLDLTGLISQCFTINDLRKFLVRNTHTDADFVRELEGLSLETNSEQLQQQQQQHLFIVETEKALLDSWEEDMDASGPVLTAPVFGPRFPNLTRLSLANAGVYASWHQLLLVSPQLSTLTHLSLAHWPTPTETPNSKASFINHNHARITLGGTHIYSEIDEDWQDPANVLRRLSNNTYSLQWLDLEGCNDWLPALTWTQDNHRVPDRWSDRTFGLAGHIARAVQALTATDPFEELQTSPVVRGPDWNGSWAQIRYINVSQGVLPCNVASLRSRPATVIAAELLFWLREKDLRNKKESPFHNSSQLRNDIHIPSWLEKESQARSFAQTLRLLRKSVAGAFCNVDHGWSAPVVNVAPKKVEE